MAAVRINIRLPKNGVVLHVPLSTYNSMVADGSWPRGTNSLVYEMRERVWHIALDHPDFERLTAEFGPGNPRAKAQWRKELDQREKAMQALSNRRIVKRDDRVFLPGLVGQTAKAREFGALWDRSAMSWYVPRHHQDAATLAARYATPESAAAAAQYHVGRASAGMDKTLGAAAAPRSSARAASAGKKTKTRRSRVATPKGSKRDIRR